MPYFKKAFFKINFNANVLMLKRRNIKNKYYQSCSQQELFQIFTEILQFKQNP